MLTMRVWVLLLHLNVLLKDPIYHHLYITHRPSTCIIMLSYTDVCNEGICQRNSLRFLCVNVFHVCILLSFLYNCEFINKIYVMYGILYGGSCCENRIGLSDDNNANIAEGQII